MGELLGSPEPIVQLAFDHGAGVRASRPRDPRSRPLGDPRPFPPLLDHGQKPLPGNRTRPTVAQRKRAPIVCGFRSNIVIGIAFVFSDGHSRMDFSNIYDDLARLDRIDWRIMNDRYWRDTIEDNDRSRRRQAEFLVHNFFPWNLIESIGVLGPRMQTRVETILQNQVNSPLVLAKSDWYY
jgi:hypothetical protein